MLGQAAAPTDEPYFHEQIIQNVGSDTTEQQFEDAEEFPSVCKGEPLDCC